MKKKLFGAITFVAIAAVAGWNYQQNKQEVKLSNLTLENVDALAYSEEGVDFGCKTSTIWCYFSNGWKYGEFYRK